jgi:hypothetical protein
MLLLQKMGGYVFEPPFTLKDKRITQRFVTSEKSSSGQNLMSGARCQGATYSVS